jgi:hypothetical protein
VPHERAERAAQNEIRFRDINEGLRRDLEKLPTQPESVPFVCECGLSACAGVVHMSIPEYEQVRASSRRFVVLPGHDLRDVEVVVERRDRYTIVEKKPDVGSLVDATDPRHGRDTAA